MEYYYRYSNTTSSTSKLVSMVHTFGLCLDAGVGTVRTDYYVGNYQWLDIDTKNSQFSSKSKISYWEF